MQLFTDEEIRKIESKITHTFEKMKRLKADREMLAMHALDYKEGKRAKMFFGVRYLYGRELEVPGSCYNHFTRASYPIPSWIHEIIEKRLIKHKIIDQGFLKMAAINIYDKIGLG